MRSNAIFHLRFFCFTAKVALCNFRAFSLSVWDILPGPPKEMGETPPEKSLEWKSPGAPLTGAIFCPAVAPLHQSSPASDSLFSVSFEGIALVGPHVAE